MKAKAIDSITLSGYIRCMVTFTFVVGVVFVIVCHILAKGEE